MSKRRCLSLLVPFLLLVPAIAHAEAPEAAPERDDSAAHLSGLELVLRPALGTVGDRSPLHVAPGARVQGDVPGVLNGASPYGAAYGAGAQIGFRFHPVFAMGLRADIATVSTTDPGDGTTNLARSRTSGGLYARGYPLALSPSLRRHVDPWLSVGVSYVLDAQSFQHPTATNTGRTITGTWALDQHSIGVPLGVGVDYRLTPAISIGPSFEYVFLAPIAGCASLSAAGFQGNKLCTDNDGRQALASDALGAWNVGLDLRLTPFR